MNVNETFGTEIGNPELDITYRQQRTEISFDSISFEGNFVSHSLEDVFEVAMRTSLNRFYMNNADFFPVAQAKVNGQYIGLIGMMRFTNDRFEFSHFEADNRDAALFRIGENWKLDAIAKVNENLKRDPQYAYHFNLTVVEYNCDGQQGCGKFFAKAVLAFLNAFSRSQVSQLPSEQEPDRIATIALAYDANSEAENIYATFTNKERYQVEEALWDAGKHQGAAFSLRTLKCS